MRNLIYKCISMDGIARGDLSRLKPHEVPEALRRFAAGMINLTAATQPKAESRAAASDRLLFDAAEAARYLSCAKSFIRKAYRSGKLPFVRQGVRYVRFTKDALDAFAMSGQIL